MKTTITYGNGNPIQMSLYEHIITYIERNIQNQFDFDQMANDLNYSIRHLRRVFQNESQCSLHEYVTERKVIHIVYEFQVKQVELNSLYQKYGYQSYDSFLRAFKRVFHHAPTKMVDQIRISIKPICGKMSAPVLMSDNGTKEDNFSYKDFKDIYWENGSVKVTSYFLYLESDPFVKKLHDLGFGVHYRYLIHNQMDKKSIQKLKSKMLSNENVEVSDKHVFLVSKHQDNESLNPLLIENLSKSGIVITFDQRLRVTDANYIKFVLTFISYINSSSVSGVNYDTLFELLSGNQTYKEIRYIESNETLESISGSYIYDYPEDTLIYLIQSRSNINLDLLTKKYASTVNVQSGFIIDKELDSNLKIISIRI